MKPVIIIAIAFVVLIPITVFAESSEITINATQLSEIKDLIKESNLINLSLLVISITIASVAILATIITAYYLKRQVKTMELEFESKLEPLLVIQKLSPSQVFLLSDRVMKYDSWVGSPDYNYSDLEKVRMRFFIKNIGQGIAKNIATIENIDEQEFFRNIFEGKEEVQMNSILAPNQIVRLSFDITAERWTNLKREDLFAGLSISYDGLKNKKYAGTIFGIKFGGNYILDSW